MKYLFLIIMTSIILVAGDLNEFLNKLNTGDLLYKQYFGDSLIKESKQLFNKKKKEPVLFVFSSQSVPKTTIKNYLADAKKLDLKMYVVYRGFSKELKEELARNFGKEKNFLAKIHPFMFKDLNITEVPTLVYAKCFTENFRYKKCDYKFKMIGDASFEYFFQKAEEIDKNMGIYYDKLTEIDDE